MFQRRRSARRAGWLTAVALSLCGYGGSTSTAESPKKWSDDGRAFVENAKRLAPIEAKAKNVILFLGDGMGITTVTAARIFEGQQRGQSGEENLLSFEKLPYTALLKTYNTNQQVGDSAGGMSAIVTGQKTKAGVLSVDQTVMRGDYASSKGHELPTILELAEQAGLATGVVTNTRITDATPAACYAHSPERKWEDDVTTPASAREAGYRDVARQLVELSLGDGLEVAFGGARTSFLPESAADPQNAGVYGKRKDSRDLIADWIAKPSSAFVSSKAQLDALSPSVNRVLGLFAIERMAYEADRIKSAADQPSLSEMTRAAINILARRDQGYFLMVEGALIDTAHHAGNAYRALTETVEFARAVQVAMDQTNRRDTLIIVTADHSHVFTMGGYPTRGNPILGLVRGNNPDGSPATAPKRDSLGLPYTTLLYANGPGYTGATLLQSEGPKQFGHLTQGFKGIASGRPDLNAVDTTDPRYLQECTIPLIDETHGGEDVPLYADGPRAHLFRGVMEQHVVFHVMIEAMELQNLTRAP